MNVKLLVGVVLFVIGLVTAVAGMAGVGTPQGPDVRVQADHKGEGHSRSTAAC